MKDMTITVSNEKICISDYDQAKVLLLVEFLIGISGSWHAMNMRYQGKNHHFSFCNIELFRAFSVNDTCIFNLKKSVNMARNAIYRLMDNRDEKLKYKLNNAGNLAINESQEHLSKFENVIFVLEKKLEMEKDHG
ncbi:MAG: hypothetical protein ABL927_14480 [Bdellovibrionales bacterium]